MNIINVRLPGYQGLQEISVTQGTIEKISPMRVFEKGMRSPDRLLDVGGEWLSLGGVDLQINGALGLAFPEVSLENSHKIPEISQLLWEQGVDGFLPTIVTTSVENIQRSLSIFADASAQQNDKTSAQILGVHLEGPFLNYQKRGAHPAEYLLPLTINNVKRILGDYTSIVKVITLAPELDETGEAIEYLRSLGITISLGHSQATETQAQRAFNTGATMVTHAFNAMPSLHHREPGLLGAAIVHPDVMCGLIADGQHVSPTMIKMLLCASNYEKGIFLVSDALSPLGLPDGIYPWDTRQIEVKNGTARLPDGTLSGTTLPLLVGVQNLVKWGCQIEDAIALATIAPRRAIGLLKEPSKRDRQKNNQPSPYLSQSVNRLLRWHLDESGELTWKRLQLRPVNGERL
ncbi:MULTISPECIES: N-acetylglucosamine-6-phosphate deacetylase [Cyanophyceae]|uniref:N-acetylglucosamine-6-phosphate deacetylase n=1 Tax=Cyanophyceae TaxID=3028117 RepID=UPI0028C4CA28|nr:N-acetylglucosamine-6-phosphate deacetylase [Trichocoleus sp. FACHB-69]